MYVFLFFSVAAERAHVQGEEVRVCVSLHVRVSLSQTLEGQRTMVAKCLAQ
jgi:hypothetical protein